MIGRKNRKSGQTMVEYIIIVVIIAIAAIAVFGFFGDTIRIKLSGAVTELDEEIGTEAQGAATDETSQEWLKSLKEDGHN